MASSRDKLGKAKELDYKKEILDRIEKKAGKYSAYEVFTDWIRCCSLSIANAVTIVHGKVWKDREKMYMDTISRYTKEEAEIFAEMLGLLAMALEDRMEDVLGGIYMSSGMGSKAAGQFFTPYHLSELCGKIVIPEPDKDGKYRINEPSCGGGGMIIAAAAALKDKGINYQRKMEVVAQDLDWKGVYMCYLQLSLLGIRAVCVQGNTLTEPYISGYPSDRVLYTPAKMGVLLF